MELKRVDIRNYRSIAETSVDFQPRCRILVGINEAGKTNILKALALLDQKAKAAPEDIREFRADEDPNQDAFVRFVFTTDEKQRDEAIELISQKILTTEANPILVSEAAKDLSLADFANHRNEVLYRINLRTNERHTTVWTLAETMHVSSRWKKPSAACPKDAAVSLPDGKSAILSDYLLVDTHVVGSVPDGYLEPADPKAIVDLYDTSIRQSAASRLPVCMYWSYQDANLLPGQIAVPSFSANPNVRGHIESPVERELGSRQFPTIWMNRVT